jgi:hypothetical protein
MFARLDDMTQGCLFTLLPPLLALTSSGVVAVWRWCRYRIDNIRDLFGHKVDLEGTKRAPISRYF